MDRPRVLWVSPTKEVSDRVRAQMGSPEGIMFVPLAANICGMAFETVIIDDDFHSVLDHQHLGPAEEKIQELYARLLPGGRMRHIQ